MCACVESVVAMSLITWVIESIAGCKQVIDAEFILTDLVEVKISEREKFEMGLYDAMAGDTTNKAKEADHQPKGKRVY